jgi:hypothetical protein
MKNDDEQAGAPLRRGETDGGAYVRRVTEDTRRYAEELMAENHRLRLALAACETDAQRADDARRASESVLLQNQSLRERVATLEQERVTLQERVLDACTALERHRREQEHLQTSMRRVQAESERFAEQYRDLEAQNANLANLYVASYRLHGTLDRQEVLSTIQEIVTNLVGSEEIGVFELDEGGSSLRLVASTGIDPEPYRVIPMGSGRIGRCAQTGETYVSADDSATEAVGEADLTACVPLRLHDRVSGAIALFRLLPQKSGIEALDRELFDLLATHAATALYSAAAYARSGRVVVS